MVIIGRPGTPGIRLGPDGPQSVMVPTEKEIIKKIFTPKTISGGGGGGSSSSQAAAKAAAAKKAAEAATRQAKILEQQKAAEKAAAEARIMAAKTQAEKNRLARAFIDKQRAEEAKRNIIKQRTNLIIKKGAKEFNTISRDVNTGDKLSVSQWRDKFGNRVQKIKNLNTGAITYASFDKGRKTGQVSIGAPDKTSEAYFFNNTKITPIPNSNKVQIITPNGQKFNISSTGRVNVGARLAGKNLVFQDGILRKINGKDLYTEKLAPIKVEKFGKTFSKARATSLIKDYTSKISKLESELKASAKAGDIQRLAELQRKKNLTATEKKEKDRLKKKVSNNYKKVADMVGLIIAVAALGAGVGSVEFIKRIRNDPSSAKQLPKEVIEGIKQDVTRAKSGPLGALNVAAEWVTLGYIFKGVGLVGKGAFKGTTKTLQIAGKIPKKSKALLRTPVAQKIIRRTKSTKTGKKITSITRKAQIASRKRKLQSAYKKELSNAKKLRIAARKKGMRITINGPDYKKALAITNEIKDAMARESAYIFLKKYVELGNKISPAKAREFVNKVNKYYEDFLIKNPNYRMLLELAKKDTSTTIKLIKVGKIKRAKIYLKRLMAKLAKLPPIRNINQVSRRVKVKTKKVSTATKKKKKKVSRKIKLSKERLRVKKRTAVKKLKRPFKVAAEKRRIKKTIKYRMLKNRPIRRVTIKQLENSGTISQMNNFIDKFFTEMAKRQKIDYTALQFKQMKNVLKKRMAKAIKKNDKVEIRNFKNEIQKMIKQMNKKEMQPDVKVSYSSPKKKMKSFKTIKDFETESPKGTFQEVRVGNQVMLQQVKTKSSQKMKPLQKMKVVSITKKKLSLNPLIKFGIRSLSLTAFKNATALKYKQITKQSQLSKLLSGSRQDFAVLTKLAQGSLSKSALAKAIMLDVNSRLRRLPKMKTNIIQKKKIKKIPKIKLPKDFQTKQLRNAVTTYYVAEKVRGKFKKLYPKSLSLSDAKDYAVYSIDNRLSKTAFFVPSGKSKNIAVAPKNIQGYYSRNAKKVRPYKIRMGKKRDLVNGFIEKRKYSFDKPGEKVQAKRLRKVTRRKITPAQRKVMLKNLEKARKARGITTKKTQTRRVVKRKISPAQRRILIERLKKARAARMRNIRKRK